jgi:hypothetical protein
MYRPGFSWMLHASADVFTAFVKRDLHLLLLATRVQLWVILVVLCLVSLVAFAGRVVKLLLVNVVFQAWRFCVARHVMILAGPAMILCVAAMVPCQTTHHCFTSCASEAVSYVIDMLYDSGTARSFERLVQSPCGL